MTKAATFSDPVIEALRDAKIHGIRAGGEHRDTGVRIVVVAFIRRKIMKFSATGFVSWSGGRCLSMKFVRRACRVVLTLPLRMMRDAPRFTNLCCRPRNGARVITGRALLLLTCLCVLAQAAYPEPGDVKRRRPPSRLYPVIQSDGKTGDKKGYIDQTGKLVIGFDRLPEKTSSAGEFQEGRAVITVKREKPYVPDDYRNYPAGYIDETGAVIIKPRFILARDFSEGLAYVVSEDFRGFIDRQGKVVISLKSKGVAGASNFREGLAAVTLAGGLTGYINRAGKWVIKPQYERADDFSEGMAAVVTHRKYGFINQKGQMVIPTRFDLGEFNVTYHRTLVAGRFSEGLACVKVGRLYGYIDKSGDFVIPPRFSKAQEFSEGLAWVSTEDAERAVANKAGWIDKTGRWVVEGVNGRLFTPGMPEFFTTYADWTKDWRYSEGLVPFTVYSGKKELRGYMNRKGEVVIQPRAFTKADAFAGGLARVSFYDLEEARTKDGKRLTEQTTRRYYVGHYGYINRTGRLVWHSQ